MTALVGIGLVCTPGSQWPVAPLSGPAHDANAGLHATVLAPCTTREERGRRGTAKDPEWTHRRRLLTAHERLSEYTFAAMWNDLIDQGQLGVQVLQAYTVKEELRALLALAATATTTPDRERISHRLCHDLPSPLKRRWIQAQLSTPRAFSCLPQ